MFFETPSRVLWCRVAREQELGGYATTRARWRQRWQRLVELGRAAGVSVSAHAKKDRQIATLEAGAGLSFAAAVEALRRDELKTACLVAS